MIFRKRKKRIPSESHENVKDHSAGGFVRPIRMLVDLIIRPLLVNSHQLTIFKNLGLISVGKFNVLDFGGVLKEKLCESQGRRQNVFPVSTWDPDIRVTYGPHIRT